jgi:SRSO17 transposase
MLAAKMVRKLQQMGFNMDLVLADSLYGENSQTFLRTLEALGLPYVVSIRSIHGVWMPACLVPTHLALLRSPR